MGNIIAKNIKDFISKTNSAGGYYIGRYEARIEGYTGKTNVGDANTDKSFTEYIVGKYYYDNNNFESDLINSYAWDTAIQFLQEYDNRSDAVKSNTNFYKEKYSLQGRLSANGLKIQGTSNSNVPESSTDKICNVYDMADNCEEWSTETSNNSVYCCIRRGNGYFSNDGTVQVRDAGRGYKIYDYLTFRPILYIK